MIHMIFFLEFLKLSEKPENSYYENMRYSITDKTLLGMRNYISLILR